MVIPSFITQTRLGIASPPKPPLHLDTGGVCTTLCLRICQSLPRYQVLCHSPAPFLMKALAFDNTQSKEMPGLHHPASVYQVPGWNTCKKVVCVSILLSLCLLDTETVRIKGVEVMPALKGQEESTGTELDPVHIGRISSCRLGSCLGCS